MTKIDPDAVLWRDAASGREGSHLLVVMHGYGSYEGDLFGLAPALPEDITIASLRAPVTLRPHAPQLQGSYAWAQLASENPDPALMDAPAQAVIDWLDSLPESFASIGLMGFSQGGAMTLQLARMQPQRYAYLVQLSGFADPTPHPGDDALKAREPRIPAFQAWGTHDDIIGQERTDAAIAWMRDHLDTELHEYAMAHSVVPEEVADIAAFLQRVTG